MKIQKALKIREKAQKKFLEISEQSSNQIKIYKAYKDYKKAHDQLLSLYEKNMLYKEGQNAKVA